MESKNVALLSVDALRADHVSCYGYSRPTTPNLDDLAVENTRFENAWSASSHTREAVPSLLTGRYPLDAVDGGYRLTATPVSAVLRETGFATSGFHSNPYISRAYGFDEGFDEFDDDLHLGRHRLVALAQRAWDKLRNRHYARADVINKRALHWLDGLDDEQPFFLWNHYMDVHGPYEPPKEYRRLFRDDSISTREAQRLYKRAISEPESVASDERQTLVDLYDAEIRYLDDLIGEFVEELRARNLLDKTLIVITADHGDAFGEHGYYEHPRYLHEELTRIPLLVVDAEASARTVDTPVSAVDVAPTLLDAAGISGRQLDGRSLLATANDPPESRWVVSSARDEDLHGRRRFVVRRHRLAYAAEYDIEDGQIADERVRPGVGRGDESSATDDVNHRSEGRAYLRRHVETRLEGDTSPTTAPEETSVEVEDRLAALGYRER